jgi:hypothetical protein
MSTRYKTRHFRASLILSYELKKFIFSQLTRYHFHKAITAFIRLSEEGQKKIIRKGVQQKNHIRQFFELANSGNLVYRNDRVQQKKLLLP